MVVKLPEVEPLDTDVLVLGGGLAGHRAAVAARETGVRVTLAYLAHGASPFVLGCNVPIGHADPRDSPEVYFEDMVRGGYGLNDRRLVRVMATQAVDALNELAAIGVPYARDDGRYLLRHLSGNTYPRSIYIPEGTGRLTLERLHARCEDLGVEILSGWKATVLLRDAAAVVGALLAARRGERLLAVHARAVVMAMGGLGRLYDDSTYPADVGADSYALAFDAGARMVDMEFVQFEPTVTVHPAACKGLEMPTAMLGDGAHLLNAEGDRFMFRYNPAHGEKRIEKARMSLCIQTEIDEGRGFPDATVVFDTTVLSPEKREGYVSHCKRLRAAGLDPATDSPRVRPAAHSLMGGILIDESGWSGVPGLFSGGEAAGGVHGASRLAGNGGSDTLVFGAVAGRGAAAGLQPAKRRDWKRIEGAALMPLGAALGRRLGADPDDVKAAVRGIMGRAAGIYRSHDALSAARVELEALQKAAEGNLRAATLGEAIKGLEARNMALAARMVVNGALARTESRGAHQRRDYPEMDDAHWLVHIAHRRRADGALVQETLSVQQ